MAISKLSKKRVFYISISLLFFLGFEAGGFQWALLHMSKTFNLSITLSSILVGTQYGIMILSSLISGKLSDIHGRKPIIIAGSLSFIIGCFITGIVTSLTSLFIGVFLIGLGYNSIECTITAALSDFEPTGRMINKSQSAFCLGAVVAPIIFSNSDTLWRFVFIIPALACLSTLVFIIGTAFPSSSFRTEIITKKQIQKSDKSRILILFLICITLYGCLENGSLYFMNLFYNQHIPSKNIGPYAISIFWIAMMIGRWCINFVKMKAEKYIPICFVIGGAMTFLTTLINSAFFSLICIFILGLFWAPIWPGLMYISARTHADKSGSIIGIMSIASTIGGTGILPIMGVIASNTKINCSYLLLAIISLVGFVVSLLSARTLNRQRKVVI